MHYPSPLPLLPEQSRGTDFFYWCSPGNYGLVFGEGVRLAHGAWSQKGALHINAIDASNGSFPVSHIIETGLRPS